MTKGILFNTEMVKAILDGRKTVTRRVIQPHYKDGEAGFRINRRTVDKVITGIEYYDEEECGTGRYIQPPYQIGDILYVRETWKRIPGASSKGGFAYKYKASEEGRYWDKVHDFKWKPSIHMPKEAARIWLKVTNVRIERVEDITEEQAHAEGFYRGWQHPDLQNSTPSETARQAFMWVWHKLYGIMNDYVWVIEFERIEKGDI